MHNIINEALCDSILFYLLLLEGVYKEWLIRLLMKHSGHILMMLVNSKLCLLANEAKEHFILIIFDVILNGIILAGHEYIHIFRVILLSFYLTSCWGLWGLFSWSFLEHRLWLGIRNFSLNTIFMLVERLGVNVGSRYDWFFFGVFWIILD